MEQALRRPATALKSPLSNDLMLIAIVRLARSDPAAAADPPAGGRQGAAGGRAALRLVPGRCRRHAAPRARGAISGPRRRWRRQGQRRDPRLDGTGGAARAGLGPAAHHHPLDERRGARRARLDLLDGPRPQGAGPSARSGRAVRVACRSPRLLRQARQRGAGPAHRRAAAPGGCRSRRRWRRSTATRGLRAPSPSMRWACASRATANGTSSCAAAPKASCARWRIGPSSASCSTAPSTPTNASAARRTSRCAFPTPFADQLVPITRAMDIDAAWVYGLIRQESRFIMDARSHVGASGLMQIMPATGRWIARKMGRRDFHPRELNELQTNLEFGTFYLKQALDDLDGSAVLASAGYNAGPGRARNWRGIARGAARRRDLRGDHPVCRNPRLREERAVERDRLFRTLHRQAAVVEGAAWYDRAQGCRYDPAALGLPVEPRPRRSGLPRRPPSRRIALSLQVT